MKRNVLLAAVVFMTSAAPAGEAQLTQADYDIRMWQTRLARDAEDGVSPANLGVAYLQKARESGDFEYYKKAERSFQTALKLIPDYRPALISLAIALNSQHRFREAIPLARKAYDALPDAGAMGVLGDALLETGAVNEAAQLYTQLVEIAPVPFAYTRMANLLLLKGDNTGALKQLTTAIETGSTGVPVETIAWCHVQIGAVYFSSGDFDHAEAHYRAALDALPQYHQALDHLAELKATRGQFDDAVALYRRLIERMPRPDLEQALGDVYQAEGEQRAATEWHAKARDGYLQAIEAGNVHYYHHLAGYYCDVEENPERALEWAQKDFELRHSIQAYDTLAWALYKNAKYTDAADAITHALAYGTKDAHLYFHAGLIYARAGDFTKGRACAQQALAINPMFEKFHVHR